MSEWAETRVAAELCRAQIDRRFGSRKLDIKTKGFEVNPGMSDIVRFLAIAMAP